MKQRCQTAWVTPDCLKGVRIWSTFFSQFQPFDMYSLIFSILKLQPGCRVRGRACACFSGSLPLVCPPKLARFLSWAVRELAVSGVLPAALLWLGTGGSPAHSGTECPSPRRQLRLGKYRHSALGGPLPLKKFEDPPGKICYHISDLYFTRSSIKSLQKQLK